MKALPRDAVIIDCVRSPMGRSKNGVFQHVRAETLSAQVIKGLLKRSPEFNPEILDDIIWGCVNQTLEQGANIGRMASLLAGLPVSVPAQTINRLCGSSMSALHIATQAIQSNNGDCFIVGGVEHMGHVPMTHGADLSPELGRIVSQSSAMMGLTAELLANKYQISRQAQDEFSVRSQQRAYEASRNGDFINEIIPIEGHDEQGALILVEDDEVIRQDTNIGALSQLRPVFNSRGSVTAGNSSAFSDGASAILIMSAEKANALGLTIKAKVRSMATVGITPALMGMGPLIAIKQALKKTGINLSEIDFIELNEAFAAQSLAVIKELNIGDFDSKINIKGGAISLGHPLGCSGTRIITTLLNTLEQKDVALGLATMCIGMGQGIATVFERN